jgi:branched-chain amino acid transport system permease protein
MKTGWRKYAEYLLVLIVAAVFAAARPLFSDYYTLIVILVFIWAFLATGWNIIGGYCGQHSLGHGLYMGVGAYAVAYFTNALGLTTWAGIVIALILAAFVAWFIGWVIFRYQLKGAYFALVTIALTEAAVYIVSNIKALGGAGGLQMEYVGASLKYLQFNTKTGYYYMGVILVAGLLLYITWASRQKFFYYLQAVRENEDAAEALGVNTVREKIKANIVSGVVCALGGVFYVQYFLYVSPRSVFGEAISVQILLFAIIGGLSTVWGPFIGAAILVPIVEITRSQLGTEFAGASLLIYGAVMVLTMLFMPYGILGLAKRIAQRIRRKPDGGQASEDRRTREVHQASEKSDSDARPAPGGEVA